MTERVSAHASRTVECTTRLSNRKLRPPAKLSNYETAPRGSPTGKAKQYEVEDIIDHRRRKDGTLELKIKWKGYPLEAASWEPAHSATRCAYLMAEYFARVSPSDARNCSKRPRPTPCPDPYQLPQWCQARTVEPNRSKPPFLPARPR